MSSPEEDISQQSQPLYEFAGDVLPQHLENAIRQGLVYPPPPSFYQNVGTPSEQPVLPPPVLPHTPPVLPPSVPPPVKKSYAWIWIVSGAFAFMILTSCAFCGWIFFLSPSSTFMSAFKQASGAVHTTQNYYQAIQSQNYETAYSYLLPQDNQWTKDKFMQEAQQLDQQYGPVQSFTLQQPTSYTTDPTKGPDFSTFNFTVDIQRARQHYTASLVLKQINGQWKIIQFNRI